MMGGDLDPEDILFSALETLYDHRQVTVSTSPGSNFTYTYPDNSFTVQLSTPDTQAANWELHASSIWVSSIFMADNILHEIDFSMFPKPVRVLELGAGAGLPGIVLSRLVDPTVEVIVSDYPDPLLMETLSRNVSLNTQSRNNCRAVGYCWGDDPSPLESTTSCHDGFDIIIGSDTLWNSSLHSLFLSTLRLCLKRTPTARIHLVAGLHTGRYALAAFLQLAVQKSGFQLESIVELESSGAGQRPWSVERGEQGEQETDRRRWVVWIILKWGSKELDLNLPSTSSLA